MEDLSDGKREPDPAHHHHHETGERQDEVALKREQYEQQPEGESTDRRPRPPCWRRSRYRPESQRELRLRVSELAFDFSQNPLFFFGERHLGNSSTLASQS